MAQPNIEPIPIKMNRRGFGLREEVKEEIQDIYSATIIEDIKKAGYTKTFGRLTIHLAKEFGFCYGVDRAVELAYETCKKFPDKRIFLTNEIIHNPLVNKNLRDMGVKFLSDKETPISIKDIKKEDVVIVPAFGTTIQQLQELYKTGCTLVDTICGSVINVWKRVEKYAQKGYTAIIHGKYYHEETQATSSQVLQYPEGRYLIVLNQKEADYVCDYIVNGGSREDFLQKFHMSMSPDFDPDLHLRQIGLANQTTMLSSESLDIAERLKQALIKKYPGDSVDDHFMSFDTICSATQERQDAIIDLSQNKPDVTIVIGGYNSSNTTHLNKIATETGVSYHIDSLDCLVDAQNIRHKPYGQKEETITKNWLKEGPVAIGITAGASTPNNIMGAVIERLTELAKV